jgi:signal peptidase II
MTARSPLHGILFVFVGLVTLAADLLTKRWAEATLAAPRAALDGFARFVLSHNPGGAGSLFQNAPDAVRIPLFFAFTICALVVLALVYRRARTHAARLGVAFVAAGALGNLTDRVRHGYVTDFIDLSAVWSGVSHHWPTFNVADVAIVAGVALLGLSSFTSPSGAKSSPS